MYTYGIDVLKNAPLFAGLNDHSFTGIIKCIQPNILSFKRGENLPLSSDGLAQMGIIIDGRVTYYYENAMGDRMLFYSAKQGDIVGALDFFTGERPFHITGVADRNCIIAYMRSSFFHNHYICENRCGNHHIVIINFIRLLTQKNIYLYRRTFFLSMKNNRQKICAFLYEQLNLEGNTVFDLPLNRRELAEYLNIPRPSLSRELCILKGEGIIQFFKNTVRVLDVQKIEHNSY